MTESLVGRRTPVTRQNGGSPVNEGRESEIANVPEVLVSASVMVVFSSFRDFSPSQSAARSDEAQTEDKRTTQQTRTKWFTRPPRTTLKLSSGLEQMARQGAKEFNLQTSWPRGICAFVTASRQIGYRMNRMRLDFGQ